MRQPDPATQPFDVSTLAASLSAVLTAPLASGSISMPTTSHSKPHRSSSSNTSQGGSLSSISSLSKRAGSRGGARLDPDVYSLKYLEEQGLLALPEHDAAVKLGVGVNTLKRHCRCVPVISFLLHYILNAGGLGCRGGPAAS